MHKRFLILFFPCLFLTGCGIKGPLYLPPDPNDSYLSRIGKQINEWTGQDMVGPAPAPVEERQQPLRTEGSASEKGLQPSEDSESGAAASASPVSLSADEQIQEDAPKNTDSETKTKPSEESGETESSETTKPI